MYWRGVYITAFMILEITLSREENCFFLYNRCDARYNCFAGLLNIKIECIDLLSGEGKVCTQSCREAIERFNKDPIGKHFLDCPCDRDAECLTYQARATKCWRNKMNTTKPGCAQFSRKCENDTACTNIMEKFYIKCTHLISGTECTPACEQVQNELYAHRITKGLLDCECSGTVKEENFCRGVRAHTYHLCKTSPLLKPNVTEGPKYVVNKGQSVSTHLKDVNSASFKLEPTRICILVLYTFLSRILYQNAII